MAEEKRRGTDQPNADSADAVDAATSRTMEHVAATQEEERRRQLAFAPDAPETPVPRPGQARILVVDDDALVRRVTAVTLRMAGYEALEAESGDDALRQLEEASGAIDLVVTDTRMPGMSGWELIEHLRREWPGQCILRISGFYENAEEVPAELSEASVPFLPKPFLPEELVRHVAVLLGR